jgi:hypothetical protein
MLESQEEEVPSDSMGFKSIAVAAFAMFYETFSERTLDNSEGYLTLSQRDFFKSKGDAVTARAEYSWETSTGI